MIRAKEEAMEDANTECAKRLDKFEKFLYQFARRQFVPLDDAEDAIQESRLAFIAKCVAEGILDGEIGHFLYNRVRDHCSRIKRQITRDPGRMGPLGGTEPDPAPDPGKKLIDNVLSEELESCLGRLRLEQRLVILKDADGWTAEEIADFMKTPVGTAKNRLRIARMRLRLCLEEKGYRQ